MNDQDRCDKCGKVTGYHCITCHTTIEPTAPNKTQLRKRKRGLPTSFNGEVLDRHMKECENAVFLNPLVEIE